MLFAMVILAVQFLIIFIIGAGLVALTANWQLV